MLRAAAARRKIQGGSGVGGHRAADGFPRHLRRGRGAPWRVPCSTFRKATALGRAVPRRAAPCFPVPLLLRYIPRPMPPTTTAWGLLPSDGMHLKKKAY